MKNKISILFIIIPMISLLGQSHFSIETEKYWYYRDRLKYFVMPGTEPGQSILFSVRNPIQDFWDGTQRTVQPIQPRMMMGFYTGMLATEYKLPKDNGQLIENK